MTEELVLEMLEEQLKQEVPEAKKVIINNKMKRDFSPRPPFTKSAAEVAASR